jgi:hypothetical protein
MRRSKAPIQANVQLGVAHSQRWCTRGCVEITDTENHLLFECTAVADVQAAFTDNELHLLDGDLGRPEVYRPEPVGGGAQ